MTEQTIVRVLEDPRQIELFDDPPYARILVILRNGELNIKEIHRRFNRNYEDKKALSSIYRYIEKLTELDLVYVSKEVRKRRHLTESYYSRTGKFFVFSDKDILKATAGLFSQVYDLDEEKEQELEKLLLEYDKKRLRLDGDFYRDYSQMLLETEKEYGFKILAEAICIMRQILYPRKYPELGKNIFEFLENAKGPSVVK
ncbi:MAG: hypothetical protein HXS52_12685 [Theionarchaea archaeon]|nr:hypothetical protein [Theionarchaea archaeon]MBU7038780.1 hypothetical protein [Theionarchaea archaeon]